MAVSQKSFFFFPDEPKFGGSDLCIHIMFNNR
uniref:Uncharacterized protein n=1 Tax=Anguilla anguilla TaxID=7936 RepID=A0A0E9RCH1_ANGAN